VVIVTVMAALVVNLIIYEIGKAAALAQRQRSAPE
jgi:hypothetical protein